MNGITLIRRALPLAVFAMLAIAPQQAEACSNVYMDYYVSGDNVYAEGFVEDYYDEGDCYQTAFYQWGYWEHTYHVEVTIESPTQQVSTDSFTTDAIPYGGGDAAAFTSRSRVGDAGDWTITILIWVFCNIGEYFLQDSVEEVINVGLPQCFVDFDLTSPQNFEISATPAMPTINATVNDLWPSSASVSWVAELTHTAPSGCSGGPTFSDTKTGAGSSSFSPVFSGFYGGELSVTATCSASGYLGYARGPKTAEVKGTNASVSDVASHIGSMSSPFDSADLRRISCHESGLDQFSSGYPVYGPGGDAGLMQICYQRTNSDLWNWKSNVDTGRSILNSSKTYAENFLDNEVANGATQYSPSMWREQSIHSYNAGTNPSEDYYRKWVPPQGQDPGFWQVFDSGGVGGYVPAVTAQSATCQ